MTIGGGARLAGRMGAAVARIAADRAAEIGGAALPRTARQLARRQVVGALLRNHRPPGAAPLPAVRGVRLVGKEFESSNCANFLLEVEFDGDEAPRTMYAKMPCAQMATRAFANAIGFWDVEAAFCARVAATAPIRVPRVHAVAQRGARFVLLLEDLTSDAANTLFNNRDMAAGTTVDRARACLETFADLHAHYWDWNAERRQALLPLALHPYLGPGGRAVTRALNAAAIAPAHRAAPDIFTARHAAICRRAVAKWDALIDYWYAEPLTLIHGDSHYANCFEYRTEAGPRIGMLDFQGVQWCRAMRDVQYFLTYSIDSELLAAHEAELIDFYLDRLAERGVASERESALDQYRAFVLHPLMVAVISLGLGSLNERDQTVRTVLRRSVAALDRLDFNDWLARL